MSKNYTQLSLIQRYQIKAFLKSGMPQKSIAVELGVHPSTISRELNRNTAKRGRTAGDYIPSNAQRKTDNRHKCKPKSVKFTAATQMKVYFCDPHSPWQRGSNENTNGLLRGFFPKGTDFNQVNKKDLLWAQEALNERPRETLGFRTPKEKLNALILEHQKNALLS